MKKVLCIFLSLLFVVALTSCGGGQDEESGLIQADKDITKEAITALDSYLDYNMTKSELKDVIEDVQKRIDENSSRIKDDDSDVKNSLRSLTLSTISLALTSVSLDIVNEKDDSAFLTQRNDLAEYIGEPKRGK